MEVKRVFDILELYKTTYRKEDVLCSKVNKNWKKYSSDDLINYSNWVSYALIKMGLTSQDKVSIISNNIDDSIIEMICKKYHADWDFDKSELSFGHSEESRNAIKIYAKNLIKDYINEVCFTR